jgi:hypothetical protein
MHTPPMSPEQFEALRERDRRNDFEDAAIADVNGEMPGATAKQRLDNFIVLRDRTADELSALQAQRTRLQALADAPATVAAKRDGLLRTLARKLLGGEEVDHDDQKALDREVATAKRRAAVAEVALVELDEKIEIQRLRVKCASSISSWRGPLTALDVRYKTL